MIIQGKKKDHKDEGRKLKVIQKTTIIHNHTYGVCQVQNQHNPNDNM